MLLRVVFSIGVLLASTIVVSGSDQDAVIDDHAITVEQTEEMKYPAIALSALIDGVVVLQVLLAEDGTVSSVVPLSGTPLLIAPAQDNVRAWRFAPHSARRAIIVFDFELDKMCNECPRTWYSLRHTNLVVVKACVPTWNP